MKTVVNRRHPWICLLAAAALAACDAPDVEHSPPNETTAENPTPPTDQAERDAVDFYISKLPDRDYVETYGDEDNPRPWYTAAEALGEIGRPAIPALIARLDSPDAYELKLALYALMLASQDPALQAETGGDYLRLGTVLAEESNAENRRLALEWWERHRHLWR